MTAARTKPWCQLVTQQNRPRVSFSDKPRHDAQNQSFCAWMSMQVGRSRARYIGNAGFGLPADQMVERAHYGRCRGICPMAWPWS